jgi:diguanylate cyclase (GGDEF)-like protein
MDRPAREQHRILIVEDEPILRKVLSNMLESEYEIVLAGNGEQALSLIESDLAIDLVLLDVVMPEMDGYEVLQRIKAMEKHHGLPVIFITSLDSAKDEEKGLRLGAADYIGKPIHPAIVHLRVRNHLEIVRQRRLLETLAGRDGLTGIANRRSFDETIESEWQRARRSARPLSLAILDVDFFKPFNDRYGHAHGDRALKAVAKVIDSIARRPTDLAARYGGEEFALLFSDTPEEAARVLAESARQAIERLEIAHGSSHAAPHLTVSIGGASMTGDEANPEALVEAADAVLYTAKRNGRNRVVWR